jgi:hypothetical protein
MRRRTVRRRGVAEGAAGRPARARRRRRRRRRNTAPMMMVAEGADAAAEGRREGVGHFYLGVGFLLRGGIVYSVGTFDFFSHKLFLVLGCFRGEYHTIPHSFSVVLG